MLKKLVAVRSGVTISITIKLTKTHMSDPDTSSNMFTIGAPDQYVGGHVAIGVVTLLESFLPVILYYGW